MVVERVSADPFEHGTRPVTQPQEATMIRSPFRLLVLTLTAALAALVVAVPAQAATPHCGITWGSVAKAGPTTLPNPGATAAAVRAGRHDCYDRLVLDVHGVRSLGTWRARYVPSVTADPSGRPVSLRGGAFLQISVGAGQGYRSSSELARVAGFTTFRQVASAGSFEGVTSIGLGVRARLPFRVLTATGIPGSADGVRVVVDVAHAW
jgi:hypothetical protein